MEILALKNRDNITNSYGITPTLPYDVEGILVEKNGKNIKIEKTIENKTVEYSLRLKENVEENLGENIEVKKEDIVSCKIEEKEENIKNTEETRKAEEIIRELGLEYTEENIRMIEHLLRSGIQITKTNIETYIKSKEYLNKIIKKLDTDLSIKLLEKGINLEEESLQKVAEAIETIENEKSSGFLKGVFRLRRELSYKEAEEISKEIYGQRMGKDVYDTIIRLHQEKLPITRENIDGIIEVLSKLKNLETLKEDAYIKVLNEDKDFNIDNLYKENNFYTKTSINTNTEAKDFENFTILKGTNIDSLREILSSLQIEETPENLNILREFIVNDMDMDRDKYEKVISMKKAVKDLIELLDTKNICRLNIDKVNVLEEDIYKLVEELKQENVIDVKLTEENIEKLKKQLEVLGNIKDKDLLNLIKNGEDFNINSIKEILETEGLRQLTLEEKTLGKTIHISKIFKTLGEELSSNVISFSINNKVVSLENLYTNHRELGGKEDNTQGDKSQINYIKGEYLKLKNSLTTNVIKESIKSGKVIEQMPINELNKFIEKKINRYKEIGEITRDITNTKGNEGKIIPLIMKNNMEMTLREIKDINSFLNGEKSLTSLLKDMTDPKNPHYREEYKEAIKTLGEKISASVKSGEEAFKEDYKDLMNTLDNPDNSNRDNRDNPKKDEYIKIQEKLSKRDMVLQIPIKIEDEYKNLNIIVPDVDKGIDKNNMKFFISLDTDNLGLIDMDIQVSGRQVDINIREGNISIINRFSHLKKSLEKIGYTLSGINRQVVN